MGPYLVINEGAVFDSSPTFASVLYSGVGVECKKDKQVQRSLSQTTSVLHTLIMTDMTQWDLGLI